MGPRHRRPGPLGCRLVVALRAPHAPQRAHRTPDRSRLGRTVRRHDNSQGGEVTTSLPASVDPKKLTDAMDGRWAHVRQDARESLRDPDFAPVYGETIQEA